MIINKWNGLVQRRTLSTKTSVTFQTMTLNTYHSVTVIFASGEFVMSFTAFEVIGPQSNCIFCAYSINKSFHPMQVASVSIRIYCIHLTNIQIDTVASRCVKLVTILTNGIDSYWVRLRPDIRWETWYSYHLKLASHLGSNSPLGESCVYYLASETSKGKCQGSLRNFTTIFHF